MNPRTSFGRGWGSPWFSSRCSSLVGRRFFRIDGSDGMIVRTWFSICGLRGPRPNTLWLLPLGLREGQYVCATATCEHTWFAEQDYCGYWDIIPDMARIRLPARCAPCDQGYTHRTLAGYVLWTRRINLSFVLFSDGSYSTFRAQAS
jgi:hypothetical protein